MQDVLCIVRYVIITSCLALFITINIMLVLIPGSSLESMLYILIQAMGLFPLYAMLMIPVINHYIRLRNATDQTHFILAQNFIYFFGISFVSANFLKP